MSLSLGFDLAPSLGFEVSPGLVAFGEMLMLAREELESVVDGEIDANEALERLGPDTCPICRDGWRDSCPACAGASGRASSSAEPAALSRPEDPAQVTDSEQLLHEVLLETAGVEPGVVEYVVGSLDQHGFLDTPLDELAAETGTSAAVVTSVLDVVRRVGPPGVGARDVRESLLLQLEALGLAEPCAEVARAVVSEHLTALARGSFSSIAVAQGVTVERVREALDLIRTRLRPYPAFDGNVVPVAPLAVPDVVVLECRERPGHYAVELVEPAFVRLRVRPDVQGAPAGAVADARTLLCRLRGRWETLRLVAGHVVAEQAGYLAGRTALRPLTRAEVAAALGVHESTVSRAVANKYALLPDRTVAPLARFFGVSGGLDEELRRLVQAAGDRPLSDQRLADELTRLGYPVARRTVAKHRARLGIPSVALR